MRRVLMIVTIATLAGATGALAEEETAAPPSPEGLSNRGDSFVGAAQTPLKDLNVQRKEIPPVILQAMENPYDEAGLADCKAVKDELAKLNSALGPDYDAAVGGDDPRITAGGIATVGVKALIPFRGAIRYVTGATAHDRKINQAIAAGSARRGFVRGLGHKMNCPGVALASAAGSGGAAREPGRSVTIRAPQ